MGQPRSLLWHCMWGRGEKGNNVACLALAQLSVTSFASHKWIVLFQVLIPRWVGLCMLWKPVGPSSRLSYETGSFSCNCNPHRLLQPEFLRPEFPTLEPCVARSVSLPSCSSQLICMLMWDHLVHQLMGLPPWSVSCRLVACPHCPGFLSLLLLLVWMNVSLTPWLSDFHTV